MSTALLWLAVVLQSAAPAPADTAVLFVGTRPVVVFRRALGAAGPGERVATAARRITLAADSGGDSVTLAAGGEGTLVLVGGHPVFVVTPGDADSGSEGSAAAVAEHAAAQLRRAMAEEREAHNLEGLLRSLTFLLVATGGLALVLRSLVLARGRIVARLARFKVAPPRAGAWRGLRLIHPGQLLRAARVAVTALSWALGLVVAYLYLTFALSQFPWTRPWGEALGRFLLGTLSTLTLGALRAVPGLFTVALILVVARFLTQLVRSTFDSVERGTISLPGLHPDTTQPTRRIAIAILWLFAIAVAYPYMPGSSSAAFKGVSVFAGLLITLGSSGLVGQAMSGLVVMYSRSFRVGDFIQAGGVQGTVTELGLLATRLRTPKNEYVTLPNTVVVASPVTDYSAASRYAQELLMYSSVTIGYDTPWKRVHELLVAAAARTNGVLPTPAPFVLQRSLDDSYVEYQINAAIDPGRAAELPILYGTLHAHIQDVFAEAGVEIMSPTYRALRDGNPRTLPVDPPGGAADLQSSQGGGPTTA